MAPESESNPWKYKFTWNPRNVVLAGQGVAKYIESEQVKYIPYHQLFNRLEKVYFEDLGEFEGYANRNSLAYRKIYGLDSIPTLLRGTLRRSGYCSAWNIFVQLGMTDDSYLMELPKMATKKDYLSAFLPNYGGFNPEDRINSIVPNVSSEDLSKLRWLGLFSDELLPVMEGSPAAVLQGILEEKWQLEKRDKDMIVMQHIFEVETEKGIKRITSSLSCFGENEAHTAMAKTVGLPLAMAADLLLDGKITVRGLFIPVKKEIYEPILDSLEAEGIVFQEEEKFVS
jgi:saccharopine dehydrogenase (NADP+, L-glutamate forming)